MLSRAEETGGNRTVRMARGASGRPSATSSPAPAHKIFHEILPPAPVPPDPRTEHGAYLLESVGLTEYFQQEDQPIFVVDLYDDTHGLDPELHHIFANDALCERPVLLDHVRGLGSDTAQVTTLGAPFADFKSWALGLFSDPNTVRSFPFAGTTWKSSTVSKRFRVITGSLDSLPPQIQELSTPSVMQPVNGYVPTRIRDPSPGYFDHIRPTRLITTSISGSLDGPLSPRTPIEAQPTPSGDMGHEELLAGPLSPAPEQRTLPAANNGELLELQDQITSENGSFDWTRLPLGPNLPAHIQFARGIDWGSTSLGAIEGWASDLRGMCNLIMASPHPAAMYWGPDHVAIYNEPYILLAGQKHPTLMGSRYCDAWFEIWDALQEVFDNAYHSAQATMKDDDCLFIMRNGFLEETYFSWSIIPLIGNDGSVVGLYNPAFEKTRRKVAERRMLTLREIGEKTAAARKVDDFWSLLIEGLQFNELDTPMVMVYSLTNDMQDLDDLSTSSNSGASTKIASLEGTLGVPAQHLAAPETIDMKTSKDGFAPYFRQALTTDRPIVLRQDDGTLNPELIEGIQWRGYGDPSRVLVICPIHPTTGESTLGFLVMGTNPRRPYDEDYELFVQLLARQLATSIASVVLFEAEIRKGERAAQLAAQDRIELNNQLVARTQEAVEAENKFTRMAELAPVGMFIADSNGSLFLVNDAWYDITSYSRDKAISDDWINYVVEDDRAQVREAWQVMLLNRSPISLEIRFKTPWRDNLGNTSHTWVLTSASPEKDEDGNLKRIFGSMTDISAQKAAESMQTKRMEDALEMKRQQEKYIDTTSHEMRNPLSAILQSADSIAGTLTDIRNARDLTQDQRELLDVTIDSAQTITLCAQHQKRIVDDVLTLSKLDSAMVVVTPVDVQPVRVVQRALKMFEAELSTSDIVLEFKVDQSYTDLGIDWVMIDPHRLSQVLINLTTNAIKFTTTQEKRTIIMYVGASTEKPSTEDKWGLTYIPSRTSKDRDVTAAAQWGLGDAVFLHFAVEDTGRGLDEEEKKQLFQRFSQANPRTHISYGGSGLGLFISRELVELQGGEIGVASEAGKGSTFAFYIKARRAQQPHSSARAISDRFTLECTSPPPPSPPTSPAAREGLNVLIVEDNLINQKVLATQLRKIGCVVHVANHGQEAIEQIMASQFWAAPPTTVAKNGTVSDNPPSPAITIDVVLMDLEMPVMDGQTCVRRLRQMQSEKQIKGHIYYCSDCECKGRADLECKKEWD
ncbi:Virulence sensor protein BvgS [Cyphellophora attinorum]|uniref:Virulence sensor protein BvgS n=1 Tax=Cyphellophora attinorum TaxID=1664694 RepID=A0A0N0NK97_9EURO|nr:Virulence sensor protein BvgS [Phialophora attinorum]KPI37579.1 Virulence sensor protein BvgS [Phialophora attinorum]